MRIINDLIVHCSASPNGKHVTVEEIRDWHVKGNGWDDIGYHYIIYVDGKIHTGRPAYKVGAHCQGHNANSIGVCLIGNDEFSDKQFNALRSLYKILKGLFPNLTIHGHRDYTDKKTCPNFEVKDIIDGC